ncbi:Uncharacterised protein [Bordetella avium]|nr:Uncharacterised protein [Bordetella avium]
MAKHPGFLGVLSDSASMPLVVLHQDAETIRPDLNPVLIVWFEAEWTYRN